jgi:CPA1 family monovalent cation:H+ antiporter
VSWIGPRLIPSGTRLQGIFFWDLIVYLIEGFVFLLTGLQARTLIEQVHAFSIHDLLYATALITAIAIAARFIWVFPATYLPRWLIPSLAKRDPAPAWQGPFLLGFTGVRGVVSLAAALAIPYTIASGAPFPHRDQILFITFGVIVITLVGQGMMLPLVVKWLGLSKLGKKEHADELKDELHARQAALKEVKKRLEKAIKEQELPGFAADHLRTRNETRLQVLPTNLTEGLDQMRKTAALKLELISAERDFIYQLLRDGKITDEARRRIEYELDLEEAGVANRGQDGGGWM